MPTNFTKEEKAMLKKLCLQFDAQYLIVDGRRIIIPLDKWKHENEMK